MCIGHLQGISQEFKTSTDPAFHIPKRGEMEALMPPCPIPIKIMATPSPGTPAPWSSAAGSDVVNWMMHPTKEQIVLNKSVLYLPHLQSEMIAHGLSSISITDTDYKSTKTVRLSITYKGVRDVKIR